jgi:hypothetical protein
VRWLNEQGYKISVSGFSGHVRKGLIKPDGNGVFWPRNLLIYARSKLPLLSVEGIAAESTDLATKKLIAETANKEAMAGRNKLKLQYEQGVLIEKEKMDQSLAARLAFFKREIETFGQRLGQELVALVEGKLEKLPDFYSFWREKTEIWLDAFAADREFVVDLDLEEITPGLLTSGRRSTRTRLKSEATPASPKKRLEASKSEASRKAT